MVRVCISFASALLGAGPDQLAAPRLNSAFWQRATTVSSHVYADISQGHPWYFHNSPREKWDQMHAGPLGISE